MARNVQYSAACAGGSFFFFPVARNAQKSAAYAGGARFDKVQGERGGERFGRQGGGMRPREGHSAGRERGCARLGAGYTRRNLKVVRHDMCPLKFAAHLRRSKSSPLLASATFVLAARVATEAGDVAAAKAAAESVPGKKIVSRV